MFKIISAREAVDMIEDGQCVAINSFLAWSNPEALHDAIYERIKETGSPRNLRLFCAAGFGIWDDSRYAEPYVKMGAVKEVVAGHFGSMPITKDMALSGEIEAYCLPLGVLSHTVRAAASGKDWILSEVGLGIYCDPRVDTYAVNDRSKKELVKLVEVEGKEYLLYYTPKIDVALIRGTTVDPSGNITFEKEYLNVDALAVAQATKRNGGKVIVEVERVSHEFSRPRNVVIPGFLIDAVVVNEKMHEKPEYNPVLSGDIHVPASQMDYYINKIADKFRITKAGREGRDIPAEIIGDRAARELKPGDVVNIGVGFPESAAKHASKQGVLKDIHMTVEPGGIGGLPAPGLAFGATIGADMISDMATQFDFYDGGGLDICFLGGLEIDRHGNVNAHKMAGYFSGIGGFANITYATKTVVFCLSFNTKGLVVEQGADGTVTIKNEGSVMKVKDQVSAISFSGKHALKRGQKVLYVTERCVFELTQSGLKLKETYPGVDEQTQVRDLLGFKV
ncbi:MAG: propionate CoA-transferase [Oscillospiraceae bacterium]|nr:propionate CoA-transferase [Oscillospiraceae bacterium]MCL2279411.1 propionate CoA-transferase [Oscillospiraceae bacterium]